MEIKNVKIVNHDSTIESANIVIEKGKIVSITPSNKKSKLTLVPGFIDTHTHGVRGNDTMDSKEAIEAISKDKVKFGTTSFLPTVMTAKWEVLIQATKNVAEAKVEGAKIAGIHVEGPFISIKKKGAHDENYIIKGTPEKLDELQEAAKGMIKKMTFAPEEHDESFVKEIIKRGMTPTMGHTNASAEQAHKAIDNGTTAVTHMWNAMTGVLNRNPGVAEATLQRREVYAELIIDFVHVDPETVKLSINVKGTDRIVGITDSIRPAGLKDGPSTSGGLEIVKKGLLITIKGTETIAGSAATMHDVFKNIISLGYSINEAVAMTSYNASKNLNIEGGRIEEGLSADFVLLKDNLSIHSVYVNGIKK